MKRFAQEYSFEAIGQQAIDQLPWGHNITLMYEVSDKGNREFYIKKPRSMAGHAMCYQCKLKLTYIKGKERLSPILIPSYQRPHSELAKATLRNPIF